MVGSEEQSSGMGSNVLLFRLIGWNLRISSEEVRECLSSCSSKRAEKRLARCSLLLIEIIVVCKYERIVTGIEERCGFQFGVGEFCERL